MTQKRKKEKGERRQRLNLSKEEEGRGATTTPHPLLEEQGTTGKKTREEHPANKELIDLANTKEGISFHHHLIKQGKVLYELDRLVATQQHP